MHLSHDFNMMFSKQTWSFAGRVMELRKIIRYHVMFMFNSCWGLFDLFIIYKQTYPYLLVTVSENKNVYLLCISYYNDIYVYNFILLIFVHHYTFFALIIFWNKCKGLKFVFIFMSNIYSVITFWLNTKHSYASHN